LSERANQLAATFEQANADAIATIEKLGEADWQKTTPEGWTVAACAHHVSSSHEGIAQWVGAIANGVEIPSASLKDFEAPNAKHAAEYATCSKAEELAELREKGAAAAAFVRSLSDEQLERKAVAVTGMPPVSAAQLIEMVLIGHVKEHVGSIAKATTSA
jgi:hypothetical protein